MLRLRLLLVTVLGLALLGAPLVTEERPDPASLRLAAAERDAHHYRHWTTDRHWGAGLHAGTVARRGSLVIGSPVASGRVGGDTYDRTVWSTRWVPSRSAFTELVPSWDAVAPRGTLVTVMVRARTAAGRATTWQSLGRWTYRDIPALHRTFGRQEDALSTVAADTLRARSGVVFTAFRLRLRLERLQGTTGTPRVRSVHAVMTRPASTVPPVSAPLLGPRVLDVPAYSQMTHRGEYPEYGGGGQAWCSPTSLAMVLAYYGAAPTPREYAWVDDAYEDRWVDETARRVYDYGYRGTGNWAFNTAYAATRLPRAVVTRLSSLRDAERFIAQDIPLIVSVTFSSGQLANAPISSTNGHLLVIVGFQGDGDVVVNDPAASQNRYVRRVYDRAQFEAAWLRRSHGLTYAMRDGSRRFPAGYIGA